ncbi:MAG: HXXEE domain-containing protein [Cognaticolwellia sp.]
MVWSKWDLGWPWMGLGAAIVLLAVLFLTDTMRSHRAGSRWWDMVWLSWLVVPIYMLHQFEEYVYDVLGRTNLIPDTVCVAQGYAPYPACPLPTAHYAVVNIALVWVAAPLAAWLSWRNPIIGLTFYGFVILNGALHVVTALTGGNEALPGVVTGVLLFIPAFCWVVYASLKSGALTAKGLAISLAGGAIAHILLGLTYLLFKAGVVAEPGMLALDIVTAGLPILIAGVGSRFVRARATEPPRRI